MTRLQKLQERLRKTQKEIRQEKEKQNKIATVLTKDLKVGDVVVRQLSPTLECLKIRRVNKRKGFFVTTFFVGENRVSLSTGWVNKAFIADLKPLHKTTASAQETRLKKAIALMMHA